MIFSNFNFIILHFFLLKKLLMMYYIETFINLILLCLLGFSIGYERQKHMKIIGYRTIILIMLGSFIYTLISIMNSGDPFRVVAQIVTGVGFIGGGIIFKNGVDDIRNLTTAVLVWVSSSIGCLCALGLRVEAIIISAITLIILYVKE